MRRIKENDENKANVRVVRPVDGRVLGSQEANLVPLPITDDRDFDYIDPRLMDEADLIVRAASPSTAKEREKSPRLDVNHE